MWLLAGLFALTLFLRRKFMKGDRGAARVTRRPRHEAARQGTEDTPAGRA
ncbi:hypothetical protein ACIBHY_06375 [Nonomuraea sp. NPDC050547]